MGLAQRTTTPVADSTVEIAVPLVRDPQVGAAVSVSRQRRVEYVSAVIELSKPRITRMVVLTAVVGFLLSLRGVVSEATGGAGVAGAWTDAVGGVWRFALTAVSCIVGVALSSSGANALNMWWESSRDALMRRTAGRPVPAGRLASRGAAAWGWGMSLAGVAVLWAGCGPVPAAVSLVTVLVYVLLYTPMKPTTVFNTLVGAVPGALPPVIGWAAAAGLVNAGVGSAWSGLDQMGGWSLFALMFVWQVPHVCALAWMHREDYARGGFRMLPIVDPTGRTTAWTVLVCSLVLLPVSLGPWVWMPDRLGWVYATMAVASGLGAIWLGAKLVMEPTTQRARAAFLGSIVHLPLLLAAMVGEVIVRWIV